MTDSHANGAGKRLLLCTCEKTMTLDAAAFEGAFPGVETAVCDNLCGREIDFLTTALGAESGGEIVIACGQEAETFEAAAAQRAEAGDTTAAFRAVDIRDRAGWTADAGDVAPKQIALLREGMLAAAPAPTMPIVSEGLCLVLGPGEVALAAAERLSAALGVTCMLTETGDAIPPRRAGFPIVRGRIVAASGRLGAFDVTVDGFAEALPGGRGGLHFDTPRDGGRSRCDIILDLTGGAPLFPAPQKRDGYLRADPRDPVSVERALFDAAQLTGEFEKPLYIRFEESLCAHSRARQPGCDRCLSLCPTGAITPNGDHVSIDPMVCAGCGACAAVCPTGAASYDDPPFEHLLRRVTTLSESYRKAGGAHPRLLVHDAGHGADLIALAARFDRGLPADVLPLEISETAGFGHAAMLAALALGFRSVDMLLGPHAERGAVLPQIALANAMAGGATGGAGPADEAGAGGDAEGATDRVRAIEPGDPAALCDMLHAAAPDPLPIVPILPLGEPRTVARFAMGALAGGAQDRAPIPLDHVEIAGGAPYGAVLVDRDACTLCLSCVGLCPTGALEDNPDRPELRFREDACVQCGICARACPETAIRLEPRFDLSDAARNSRILHEEEPFACIECGREFGVKSTIERITEKLAGKNWMYTASDNVRLIQMCDDCRVNAQFHSENSPFQMGARPKVRTTEDYLREREREARKDREDQGGGDA